MNAIGQMPYIQVSLKYVAAKIYSINILISIIEPILISIGILCVETITT